jgi:hypothetical protein
VQLHQLAPLPWPFAPARCSLYRGHLPLCVVSSLTGQLLLD